MSYKWTVKTIKSKMVDSVGGGEYKKQTGDNMRKRIVLDDQVREGLIKNIYVHNVTRYNIYFTSEFREKAYLDLMAGKSMLKIFSECKLPISVPLLSRKKHSQSNN